MNVTSFNTILWFPFIYFTEFCIKSKSCLSCALLPHLQLLQSDHALQGIVFDRCDVVHTQTQNLQASQTQESITGDGLDFVVLKFEFDQICQPLKHTRLVLNGPGDFIVVQLSVDKKNNKNQQ